MQDRQAPLIDDCVTVILFNNNNDCDSLHKRPRQASLVVQITLLPNTIFNTRDSESRVAVILIHSEPRTKLTARCIIKAASPFTTGKGRRPKSKTGVAPVPLPISSMPFLLFA
ncbi:hypothetical protein CDAR_539481 [Caerostris darwini]|uniref:Uncharacterized protein n=1 Tax=Caerostris darwini TaxID=1538125 RepID=A0AAV4MYC8_9ARAC|nr:hypothetical protein CDAR_539481 [Caerostris darwini]